MPRQKDQPKNSSGERRRGRPRGRTKKPRIAADGSAEDKIKEAARKLFTKKGFAATRTRDIAEEAGINLALLNYYFRSKQRLFDLIMMENFQHFLQGITVNLMDDKLNMEERITRLVTAYIDFLTEFPDLPLFILNEIRSNPTKIADKISQEIAPARGQFFRQLAEAHKAGKIALEPFQFIANLIGLTIFPFIGRPLLQRVTNTSDEQFHLLMQERKKLVPLWMGMMLRPHDKPAGKPSPR